VDVGGEDSDDQAGRDNEGDGLEDEPASGGIAECVEGLELSEIRMKPSNCRGW